MHDNAHRSFAPCAERGLFLIGGIIAAASSPLLGYTFETTHEAVTVPNGDLNFRWSSPDPEGESVGVDGDDVYTSGAISLGGACGAAPLSVFGCGPLKGPEAGSSVGAMYLNRGVIGIGTGVTFNTPTESGTANRHDADGSLRGIAEGTWILSTDKPEEKKHVRVSFDGWARGYAANLIQPLGGSASTTIDNFINVAFESKGSDKNLNMAVSVSSTTSGTIPVSVSTGGVGLGAKGETDASNVLQTFNQTHTVDADKVYNWKSSFDMRVATDTAGLSVNPNSAYALMLGMGIKMTVLDGLSKKRPGLVKSDPFLSMAYTSYSDADGLQLVSVAAAESSGLRVTLPGESGPLPVNPADGRPFVHAVLDGEGHPAADPSDLLLGGRIELFNVRVTDKTIVGGEVRFDPGGELLVRDPLTGELLFSALIEDLTASLDEFSGQLVNAQGTGSVAAQELASLINMHGGAIIFDRNIVELTNFFMLPGMTMDWNLLVAGAVPEPLTCALLCLGWIVGVKRRHRSLC